jgi:DNA-binding response OmpR family regulator
MRRSITSARARPTRQTEAGSTAAGMRGRSPGALLVEQQAGAFTGLRARVEARGIRATVASGESGLLAALARAVPGDLDAVILSLGVDDASALSTIPMVRMALPEAPVIVICPASAAPDPAALAFARGADACCAANDDLELIAQQVASWTSAAFRSATRPGRRSEAACSPARSGVQRVVRARGRGREPLEIAVHGSGASWLSGWNGVLGWRTHQCASGPDLLDAAEWAALTILAPTVPELPAALALVSCSRRADTGVPVLLLIDDAGAESASTSIIASAYARGASFVLDQQVGAQAVVELAQRLISGRQAQEPGGTTRPPLADDEPPLEHGELRIEARVAYRNGQPVLLTPIELTRLRLLLQHAEGVVSHVMFEQHESVKLSRSALRQSIFQIRAKLGDRDRTLITTVHGFGWCVGIPHLTRRRASVAPGGRS